MQWKLGDFVRFVDEKMEGYVTRIISDDMIGVTGEDDFEIPVPASKVTSVHGFVQPSAAGGKAAPDVQVPIEAFKKHGVHLGFTTDEKAASVVHFHLVNDTSFQLLSTLITNKNGTYKGEFSGVIQPGTAAKLYSAQLADIQLWPAFELQVLFYTTTNIQPTRPVSFTEKFKAKDFAGTKKQLPILNKAGWIITLDEPEPIIDAKKLKESFFKSPQEKVEIERPLSEVDLHIEKLRDDYQFLNGTEILDIQMAYFHKALDAAIVHQLPQITFIHGAGNGILRHELHKQVGKHPKVQTFMDARKEKFGYGATKVLLK
jgi:hypothetical protein